MNKQKEYIVNKESTLLDYLLNDLNIKRSEAKKLLSFHQVYINEKEVSKFDYPLNVNDKLRISSYSIKTSKDKTLDIIYEDKDFIVINKPAGLLSISTTKEKDNTAYHLVRNYLNNKHEKCFVLHRLDKDTSGILVFVKSEKLKEKLQDTWNDNVRSRNYYAVVTGEVKDKHKRIVNYLKENSAGIVYVTKKDETSKEAITEFDLIKTNKKYSLLDVSIYTGRKNQIRVTLSDYGHPVVGDEKYGEKKCVIKRLALHAYELSFINPLNKKEYEFKTEIPKEFAGLINIK